MFVWFFFLISISFLLMLYNNPKTKKKAFYALLFFLIYFSAFRDGLGQDYSNYLFMMSLVAENGFSYLSEPAFALLALVVDKTFLSPVLFFLLTSIIIVFGICTYIFDDNNNNIVASMLVFCLMPTLFFNTFNVVRQFVATGIFLYSLRYVYQHQFFKYAGLIIIASLFHISAILLIPIYFLLYKKRPIYVYMILAALLYFVSVNLEGLLQYAGVFDARYGVYVSTEEKMGNSIMILLYNILAILLLLKRQNLTDNYHIVTMNMFVLLVVVSDLSFVNFYFFRLSVYFLPSFCIVFPLVVKQYIRFKNWSFFIPATLSLYLFISFILVNNNNPKICPSKILMPQTLVDGYYDYNRYYNRLDVDY